MEWYGVSKSRGVAAAGVCIQAARKVTFIVGEVALEGNDRG